jgi:hypothetical protein
MLADGVVVGRILKVHAAPLLNLSTPLLQPLRNIGDGSGIKLAQEPLVGPEGDDGVVSGSKF